MKRFRLASVVAVLALAAMLTGCAEGTEGKEPVSEQSEGFSNSEKISDSQKTDESQKESETEEPGTTEKVDEWTKLTDIELKWFNEEFFNSEGDRIMNYFLNMPYADVKNIDIYCLFENEPSVLLEITDAELAALKKTDIDMDLDIHKIPEGYLELVLKSCTNLTLEETSKIGLENLVYLKDFNAYYLSTGDYAYHTYTMTSGQKSENGIVKLQYQHGIEDKLYEVTLKAYEEGYYFVSNLAVEE